MLDLSSQNYTNPCFTICDGQLCNKNYIYLKKRDKRELSGTSPAVNYWPADDGRKQHLVFLTYTFGFCPKMKGSNSFGNYENNFSDTYPEIEALVRKQKKKLLTTVSVAPDDDSGNWTTSADEVKVCMRRLVVCNPENKIHNSTTNYSTPKYNRSYTLLSTD